LHVKVLSDVRLAVRQLTRAPGFAASVVVTLAIGLGVNTSVFRFVNDFFLRPLPVSRMHHSCYYLQPYGCR